MTESNPCSHSCSDPDLLRTIRFVGISNVPMTALSGVSGKTKLPESLAARRSFLARPASPEIEKELDWIFDQLREAFGLKRRQLKVDGPVDGSGSITTDAFQYRIDLELDPDAERRIAWHRSVGGILQPSLVFSNSFQKVFGEMLSMLEVELASPLDIESIIDHIEDASPEMFGIRYNREATWCEVTMHDADSVIKIERDSILVSGPESFDPRSLFECYQNFQSQFLATLEEDA